MSDNGSSQWLSIAVGDSVKLTVCMSTAKVMYKHWIDARQRSYLCFGDSCQWCQDGFSKRLRYVVEVFADQGERRKWEIGDDIMRQLSALPQQEGFIKITVQRLGDGRKTRYQVSPQNKYTAGRYGHMVIDHM